MKKALLGLFTLALLAAFSTTIVSAGLSNPTVADVTIATGGAKSGGGKNYVHFPDIVKAKNNTLLVAYYENSVHAPSSSSQPFGKIQLVKSTNNGNSWSSPTTILDSAKLASYGIKTSTGQNVEARDPNFAVLPDGTILLTFFTRRYGNESVNPTKVYMMESTNNGESFSKPILVPCPSLDRWYAKRGDIAVFPDGQILIPVYGGGSKYGNAGVATNILAKRTEPNTWNWQGDRLLATSSSEGASVNEASLVNPIGSGMQDTVYAMIREPGTVLKSIDRGLTWSKVGTQGSLHQPGMTALPDGRIFATWTKINNSSMPRRPIYGKMFNPKLGWPTTYEQLIFKETSSGGTIDMGDPSSVYTADGRLLTVWYNTTPFKIQGSFSTPSEWTSKEPPLPVISGKAKDVRTGGHQGALGSKENISDTITIKNLLPGQYYAIDGTLYNGTTGKLLTGTGTHLQVGFVPTSSTHTITLDFKDIDTSGLAGQTIIVYLALHKYSIYNPALMTLKNSGDANQAIYYSKVSAEATTTKGKGHQGSVVNGENIVNKITLSNLIVGRYYALDGTLYDATAGKLLTGTGTHKQQGFTATAKTHTVNMEYNNVDTSGLAGHTIITYLTLHVDSINRAPILTYKNSGDAKQAVYYPNISAETLDSNTNRHQGTIGPKESIASRITLTNLVVGRYYALDGTLYDGTVGKLLTGTGTHRQMGFTATDKTHTINMEFKDLNTSDLAGHTIITYLTLHVDSINNVPIMTLKDSGNANQAIYYPNISAEVREVGSGSSQGTISDSEDLIDTITLNNLIVGQYYALDGTLYNATDGELLIGSGTHNQVGFTATAKTHTIEMDFRQLDTSELGGHTITVYLSLHIGSINNVPILIYKTPGDSKQSIHYPRILPTAAPTEIPIVTPTIGPTVVPTSMPTEIPTPAITNIYTLDLGSQTTDSVLNDSFFDIVPSASGGSAIVREENGEKYIELTRGSNSGGATLSVKPATMIIGDYMATYQFRFKEGSSDYQEIYTSLRDQAPGAANVERFVFNVKPTAIAFNSYNSVSNGTAAQHILGEWNNLKIERVGTITRIKTWTVGAEEPSDWVEVSDLPEAGRAGKFKIAFYGATTNAPGVDIRNIQFWRTN